MNTYSIESIIDIRTAIFDDAPALSKFMSELDNESDYLLYNQGERENDLNITRKYLERMDANKKSTVIIAEDELKNIVGFICGAGSTLDRISHVMQINVGILKKYRRNQLATRLVEAVITHAKKMNITRLEASIIKENAPSIKLSEKFKFEVEGIKKKYLKINDQFYDAYIIAHLIE